jgi:hypothetical protein
MRRGVRASLVLGGMISFHESWRNGLRGCGELAGSFAALDEV